jgi:hypothetical protein
MAIEYHLLPPVKTTVAHAATVLRYVLAVCAALALAELVLLPLHMPLAGIACGLVSAFLLQLALALLVLLAAWCQPVLLAGQGNFVARWLVRVGALLAPLAPVCWLYSMLSGELLLYRQAELPLILGVLLVVAAVVNVLRMAAAPWKLQLRIVALPVLLLVALVCNAPGVLLYGAVFKLLAAWVAAGPLHKLAAVAPRVIAMPDIN